MAKSGEINYLKKMPAEYIASAINKPFSEPACANYLLDLGSIMTLLPNPPRKLLDLGCGTGWTSCFFAKRGYEVTGQDIAEDMIILARQKSEKEGLKNIAFVCCDFENMDFAAEFDCAVFYDSLHHSENPAQALKMVHKALKPGGICLTCEPGKGHSRQKQSIRSMDEFNVSENDLPPRLLCKLGQQAGFQQFQVYPRITSIAKAIYNSASKPIVKFLLNNAIFQCLSVIYIVLFLKKTTAGIVVMKKSA